MLARPLGEQGARLGPLEYYGPKNKILIRPKKKKKLSSKFKASNYKKKISNLKGLNLIRQEQLKKKI